MALNKKNKRASKKNGDRDRATHRGLNLKTILPKTNAQQEVFDSFDDGEHLLLHGMAGTGKTYISLYLALYEILNNPNTNHYDVTVIRSVVPTRDIGHLPGKESDKIAVYEEPYISICNELFDRGDAYSILKQKKLVNFMCTSFIRGVTLSDTIVIIDEINNMSFHELDSLITRLGHNCRVIFCGDFRQSDLTRSQERNGLSNFIKIIDELSGFNHIEFDQDDIVRSLLVKEYIIAREQLGLCA